MLFATETEPVVDEGPSPDANLVVCIDHERREPVKPPRPDSEAARWWRDAYRQECRESAKLAALLEREQAEGRTRKRAEDSLLETVTRLAAENAALRDRVTDLEAAAMRGAAG